MAKITRSRLDGGKDHHNYCDLYLSVDDEFPVFEEALVNIYSHLK